MAEARLSTKTLIPLGVTGSMIIVIMGGVVWLTQIFAQTNANAEDIQRIKTLMHEDQAVQLGHRKRLYDKFNDVNERLARIEGKLTILIEQETK